MQNSFLVPFFLHVSKSWADANSQISEQVHVPTFKWARRTSPVALISDRDCLFSITIINSPFLTFGQPGELIGLISKSSFVFQARPFLSTIMNEFKHCHQPWSDDHDLPDQLTTFFYILLSIFSFVLFNENYARRRDPGGAGRGFSIGFLSETCLTKEFLTTYCFLPFFTRNIPYEAILRAIITGRAGLNHKRYSCLEPGSDDYYLPNQPFTFFDLIQCIFSVFQ